MRTPRAASAAGQDWCNLGVTWPTGETAVPPCEALQPSWAGWSASRLAGAGFRLLLGRRNRLQPWLELTLENIHQHSLKFVVHRGASAGLPPAAVELLHALLPPVEKLLPAFLALVECLKRNDPTARR